MHPGKTNTIGGDDVGKWCCNESRAVDKGPATITPTSMLRFLLQLVVALSDLFTDESFDTSGNEGGVMGDEGGFNSVDSYNIMTNRALMCLP